jgi:hypothetical protein
MNAIQGIGLILIILGAFALIYQRFTYTTREQVVKIGPIEATAEKRNTVLVPPIIGVVILAGGVAMLVKGNRRRPGQP